MSSLYANRMPAAMSDSLDHVFHQPFLKSGVKEARVIVCADGDLMMNKISDGRPYPLDSVNILTTRLPMPSS